ncbi:MacB-like periplasmic core domain protein [uncultured archaeon]|nr:MacB-like periplasmic core domain protein [uncultured archaeon]
MIKDVFNLSVNSMKKRKLRSWLTLLGIFIGIAAVVSLISLGDGLRTAITGQFGSLSVDTLTVQNAETGFGPPGSTAIKKLTDHDLKLAESVSGVKIVIPRLIRVAKIEYNKDAEFSYLGSLPEDREKLDFIYENLNTKVDDGRLLTLNDHGKVILGSNFASENMFGKKLEAGSKITIQGKSFIVAGILKPGSSALMNGVVMMFEKDMKDALDIGDEIDLIVVRVEDKDNIEKVAGDIKNKFRKDRKEKIGEEDFTVQTPVQSLAAVNTILNIINIIVVGIASISLLIGGIGIANTMYTSVLERTKEIGTMKAIGAKNRDIMSLFVIESGLFGLIGGIAGAIFGLFLSFLVSTSANTYFGENIITIGLSWPLLIGAISFSFFIGIFAGLIPSYQASKLKPVDALRG